MTTILSTTYCGPVQWYQKLYRSDLVLMECHETFQKQTYRNRCVIATTNGLQTLTVPVERGTSPFIRDIRISNHGNWRHQHWHALMSAYNESPFFDYYQDDFRPFFEKKYDFLYDFNMEICQKVCELIDIQPNIRETSFYRSSGVQEFRSADNSMASNPSSLIPHLSSKIRSEGVRPLPPPSPWRGSLTSNPSSLIPHPSSKIGSLGVKECRSADNSLRFSGSKDLITSQPHNLTTSSESPSLREGLGVGSSSLISHPSSNPIDLRSAINPKHPDEDADFVARRYYQVYERKHGFLPNLSILDLLFNMGPESVFWL